jgi:polar amino acid transport system substrate-binding protein
MKKTLLFAAAALSMGLASSLPAQAQDVIRFGLAAEPYAPFSVKDASGTWTGWEVELRDAVCEEMNAECEWVEVAWDGIIPALLENKFDVIWSSMSITDERLEVISFTDKYYFSPAVWVGARSDTRQFDPADPASLEGIAIGAQGSTSHQNYLEQYFQDQIDLKLYDTLDAAESDLKAGRIDLLMASGIQISDWFETPDGADYEIKVRLPNDQLFGYGNGGGVRQEDTELRERLNAAITAVRDSGKYAEITARYFDFDIYE